jgi:translation initiation factor IF-2
LSDIPTAGDHFMAFDNEKQAKDIASKRRIKKEEAERAGSAAVSLDDLNARFLSGEVQELNLLIKPTIPLGRSRQEFA